MEPRELVQASVRAFNRADVEALARFYGEGATNHQVAEAPVVGRDAIREMFASGFARVEMTCIVEHILQDGEWAVLEWRDPRGLRGCGFFQVVGGEIVLQRGYWDKLSSHASQLLRQGVNVKAVGEKLGHSTIQLTLDTYSHLLGDWQAPLAAGIEAAYREALAERESLRAPG